MTLEFTFSEQTDALDEALAKFQGEVSAAAKDSTNPHFRSKYADLTAVWEACRAPLAANSINVTQWPMHSDDDRLHLVTRVAHKGQWMMAHFSMPVSKADPQGYGSATTYGRRYALAAALGIVADDDDDGNAASAGKQAAAQPPAMSKKAAETTEAAIKAALELCATASEVKELINKHLTILGELPNGKAIYGEMIAKGKAFSEKEKAS